MQNLIKIFRYFNQHFMATSPPPPPEYNPQFSFDDSPLVFELSITLVFIFWSQNGTLAINNLVFYADIVLREAAIEFLLV